MVHDVIFVPTCSPFMAILGGTSHYLLLIVIRA